MRFRFAILMLVAFLVSACAQHRTAGRASRFDPPPHARLNAVAEAEMERQGIPGLAIVVMRDDALVLARGFGRESIARDDPVTPETVFQFNSISKQFLAAVVLQLAEEGRLSLDDPVSRHLPDWTRLPPGLTIRHLLSHTSGMREEFVQPHLMVLFARTGVAFAEYAAAARTTPADFPPGSRWSYSNMNYLMLTLIVERATGQALEIALEERLFRPHGLASIRLCPSPPGQRSGGAAGHVERDGRLVIHPPEPIHLFRGSGGYCGTALDLARWSRALALGRVVSPASYALMTTPAPLNAGGAADYGLGLALVAPDGVHRIGHGGYGGGFSAQAAYYPETRLTTVVIANRFIFAEHIERRISRTLLGLDEPPTRDIPLSRAERARFVGRFDVGIIDWHPRIEECDGRLWFALPDPRIELPLAYLGGGEFVSADDPLGYRLSFSADGRELRLLGMGLMTWYGRRVETD
ncbi:MAG: beta-lactamase family protein [Sphingomonadaceae bacterium]|nr:beta-lactamase family protein [Sphingomonadaceae bacterium]